MFEVVRLDLARQWFTPSLAEVAELLVYYDKIYLRTPWGRLASLLNAEVEDVCAFRQLVDDQRISIELDQMPLGEIARELGFFQILGDFREDPVGAADEIESAFRETAFVPFNARISGKNDEAKFQDDWARIISATYNPVQQAGFGQSLIERALGRLKIIVDQDFIANALQSYGQTASPQMQVQLSNIRLEDFEYEGRLLKRFDAPHFGSTAELLEFLSQADEVLDVLAGVDGDSFTSPTFDIWSQSLVQNTRNRLTVREEVDVFQKSVLGQSGIASAIKSGSRRFRDILPLLDQREAFAKAVRDRPPEESLVKSYFDEIANISWLSSGVGKVLRFAFFAGAGAVTGGMTGGAGIGVALGALDAFVIDKVFRQNKSRKFIETDVTTFVDGKCST